MRTQPAPAREPAIVIVGAGPTGLALAIEACTHDSKNRPVIIITNRQEYTRKEVIKIEEDDSDYLQQLLGAERHGVMKQKWGAVFDYDQVRQHRVVSLQTKGIELSLQDKLNELLQQGRVEVIHSDSLLRINKHTHQIILGSGRVIPFEILLEADGAKHPLADVLHDPQDMPIHYYPAQNPQMATTHGVTIFTLPHVAMESRLFDRAYEFRQRYMYKEKDIIAPDRVARDVDPVLMRRLRKFGWQYASLPEVRIFASNDILYVAGECPFDIANDSAQREQWFRLVMQTYIRPEGIAQLTIDHDHHGKDYNHRFDVTLDEAVTPVQKFPKLLSASAEARHGAYYVVMGDALRKAHYQTGSGALSALRQAKAFGEFLQSSQKKQDWRALAVALNKLRDENRDRINGYLRMRAERENAAKPTRAGDDVPVATKRQQSEKKVTIRKKKTSKKKKAKKKHKITHTKNEKRINEVKARRAALRKSQYCDDFPDVRAAFTLLGIKPEPLLVCDVSESLPRFNRLYADALQKLYGDELATEYQSAARLIREHLAARELAQTAHTMKEFTTYLYNGGKLKTEYNLLLSRELKSKKPIHLAYSTTSRAIASDVHSTKTFHFYNCGLRRVDDVVSVDNIQYCRFVIAADGACSLVLPFDSSNLPQQVRARMHLPVDVSEQNALLTATLREKLANAVRKTLNRDSFSSLIDYVSSVFNLGGGDKTFYLAENEIEPILRLIHELFCVNSELTVEQFIDVMNSKIDKRKLGEVMITNSDPELPQAEPVPEPEPAKQVSSSRQSVAANSNSLFYPKQRQLDEELQQTGYHIGYFA